MAHVATYHCDGCDAIGESRAVTQRQRFEGHSPPKGWTRKAAIPDGLARGEDWDLCPVCTEHYHQAQAQANLAYKEELLKRWAQRRKDATLRATERQLVVEQIAEKRTKKVCGQCDGEGSIPASAANHDGMTCPSCEGRGFVSLAVGA